MNFSLKEYLPDSEERIDHLRKIIAGRPVAILAAGPSITELEKRIFEIKNADVCYFGLNNFSVQETHILQQIDKRPSVVMCSNPVDLSQRIEQFIDFLNRDEDNLFISSLWRNPFELLGVTFDLNQFISDYNKKIIFFCISLDRKAPNIENPLHFSYTNSLLILIQLAIVGKASKILLFGADGHCDENSKEYYYRSDEYGGIYYENLIHDTRNFNAIAPVAIKNVYKTYNLEPIEILNCSERSFYTAFPKVSYNDAFDCLLTGRKFDRRMDLRVPKVSVISLYLNKVGFLRETIENISRQSYTNHEHIIIYNEDDDKIQDICQQFPFIIWIPVKNLECIKALEKGISIARGDYIFFCRSGEGYLDQDWFCTCAEILEYNHDISLVWGLSQDMNDIGTSGKNSVYLSDNPPTQAKNFIYYWLKKRVLFPEGNLCVRKKVLEECFPFSGSKTPDEREAWASFNYRFNVSGYQPFFIPTVANYCRTPGNNEGQGKDQNTQNRIKDYYKKIGQYEKQLIRGKTVHHYRNGSGELLPEGFNRRIYLFFITSGYINRILPDTLSINVEKYLDFWMTYRWKALKVGPVLCWHRLIRPYKIKPPGGE